MKELTSYINEALIPPVVWKRVGMILLSTLIPFLISLGVRIASLKINNWLNSLEKKHPEHKEAIDILAKTINDHFGGMDRCNKFISDVEQQKVMKKLTPADIKKEVLPLIDNADDKKKVEDLLNMIESDKFQEEIDECIKNTVEDMITEGLNININDIEDDDLRKKVVDYFKTFKKGKLEDQDLAKIDDEDKDEDEDEDEDIDKEFDDMMSDLIEKGYVGESVESTDESINEAKELPKYNDALITAKIMADEGKEDAKKLFDYLKRVFIRRKDRAVKFGNSVKDAAKDAAAEITREQKKSFVNLASKTLTVKHIEKTKRRNKDKWEKYEKEIAAARASKEAEKDSEGNIVKKEEITNKEGKKVKVTTHTGPRGGKFYWPEGSPKDAEHKVYISKSGKVKECMDLKDYLCELF